MNVAPDTEDLEIELVEVDARLAAEWQALATALSSDPFVFPGWFAAWAAAFSSGELSCVTARRAGALVGVLPVVCRDRAIRSATNSETPRYRALVEDPSILVAMASDLRRLAPRLTLEYLPSFEASVDQLMSSVPCVAKEIRRSPSVSTSGETYESWTARRMSKRSRTNHRRMERRLRDRGTVTFEVLDGRDHLGELLEEGFSVEAAGWKGRMGTDVMSREGARRFYWEAGRWAAQQGFLRLGFVRVDGRPVAFAYAMQAGGLMGVLKLAFDEEFKPCGPGLLLVQFLIREAFTDEAVDRFDFHGEAVRFKTSVADDAETQVRIDIFAPGLRGRIRAVGLEQFWVVRGGISRRFRPEVRERVDTSSPSALGRSVVHLVGEKLGRSPFPRSRS